MSRTITRTRGSMALAWAMVKYFFPGRGLVGAIVSPSFQSRIGCGGGCLLQAWEFNFHRSQVAAGLPGAAGAAGAGFFGGGGGSGGLVQTGPACTLEPATAVGLRVSWPHAVSSGRAAKSMIQPSRLKQLWSNVEPMKMQSTGQGSTHRAQNMHL